MHTTRLAGTLFASALLLPATAPAQATRLLRQPTVSQTHIAFAYANDLWIVPRAGGEAKRLTTFPGTESNPHFSPDGRLIAFTAEYDGNQDVYVVPAEGGEPRRLTWHPSPDLARGWTPDGRRIVFASGRTSAPVAYLKLWTVSVDGGMEDPLPLPRAYTGAHSPDGKHVAYQEVPPPNNQWRNYRGGQTQPIWVANTDSYDIEKLPWENSNDAEPRWIGNTIYFLSDRDWAINLFAYDTQAKKLAQVTLFAVGTKQ